MVTKKKKVRKALIVLGSVWLGKGKGSRLLGDLPVEGNQVGFLDGEHFDRSLVSLGIGASRGDEVRFKLVTADFDTVDLEGALDAGVRSHRQAEEAFALVLDNEGEVNPLAPRQGLDFATLVVGDAFLDRGQVGEVDARTEHTRGGLFEHHALGVSVRLGVGLEGDRGELALAGEEGGQGVGSGGRHSVVGVGGGGGVVGGVRRVRHKAYFDVQSISDTEAFVKQILTRKITKFVSRW